MKFPTLELMAPAGDWNALSAALRSGADSVYAGVGKLNMRSWGSANFAPEDLPEIVRLCRKCSKKFYLTVNTIIYNSELDLMHELCDCAKTSGVDAVIASDLSVITYCAKIKLPIHISVQANICNIEAVKFFAQYAEVMVLARELSLADIQNIALEIKKQNVTGPGGKLIQLEAFIHGALCVAVSGRCFLSQISCNASANRGSCMQLCRRKYKVSCDDGSGDFEIDHNYVFSPKDLCMVRFMEELVSAGIKVFKIEGRGRSADYVSKTVGIYRQVLDLIISGKAISEAQKAEFEMELAKVFNRGFWHGGYYLGENLAEWSMSSGSLAHEEKIYIGKVTGYFNKIQVAEVRVDTMDLSAENKLLIIGRTTGALEVENPEFIVDGESVKTVKQHKIATLKVPGKVRVNDLLYKLVPRRFGVPANE